MNTVGKRKNISLNSNSKQEKASGSSESSSTLLERSQYSLDLVNTWINVADTKVSISCGVFSVIIAVIVFVAENLLGKLDEPEHVNRYIFTLFHISVVITVVMFLVSIFFHIRAISPSFFSGSKSSKKQSKKRAVQPAFSIFYDEIRAFENSADYVKAAKGVSEEQFTDEILKEVYYNSTICSQKMRRFKSGICFAFVAILMCIVSCSLYYFAYTCI